MTRAAAEQVVQRLLRATGALNETTRIVQAEGTHAMAEEYRTRAAEVMAAIYLDLVKPVVKEYPDLDPGTRGRATTPRRP